MFDKVIDDVFSAYKSSVERLTNPTAQKMMKNLLRDRQAVTVMLLEVAYAAVNRVPSSFPILDKILRPEVDDLRKGRTEEELRELLQNSIDKVVKKSVKSFI